VHLHLLSFRHAVFLPSGGSGSGIGSEKRENWAHCQLPEPLLNVFVDVVTFLVGDFDKFPIDLGDDLKYGCCDVQCIVCPAVMRNTQRVG